MSVQVQLRRDTYANLYTANVAGTDGELFVDKTNHRVIVNDGTTAGGFPAPVTMSVQNGGSTNNSNSGSGAFIDHTPTVTIPANFMIAARAFRVTAQFQITSGSAPPNLNFRLRLGSTTIYTSTAVTPTASMTNVQMGLQWVFQATAAPGASVNVQCVALNQANGPSSAATGQTTMPVAVATNASQAVTIATQWSAAGTGTNTIGLNQLIVEALN